VSATGALPLRRLAKTAPIIAPVNWGRRAAKIETVRVNGCVRGCYGKVARN
jgi:hypothetical protein